ncbi:MAG: hypothetical protein HY400_06790 [Elusimicrobia bacterium]|nr:hypothetical protein [Elusimicrobiota bacterium]
MGKKHKKVSESFLVKNGGISRRGWKVIGFGIGTLLLGFFVLSKTDPMGQNWASRLAPFLILGGYGVIAIGIMLPDKSVPTAASNSSHQPSVSSASPQ